MVEWLLFTPSNTTKKDIISAYRICPLYATPFMTLLTVPMTSNKTKTNCRIAVVALIRVYNLNLNHQHNYQHADRLPAQT